MKNLISSYALIKNTAKIGTNTCINPFCDIMDCWIGDECLISNGVCIKNNAIVGPATRIGAYANLYGCILGCHCKIGPYVEIQSEVKIGNHVSIQSHSFICSLVMIEDHVFLGHGVMTINDLYPPSKKRTGMANWKSTQIKQHASIGSNATLNPVVIGEYAIVGAGAVVTKDVAPYSIVVGNPARHVKWNTSAPGFECL